MITKREDKKRSFLAVPLAQYGGLSVVMGMQGIEFKGH
jgi:hypothetical protein